MYDFIYCICMLCKDDTYTSLVRFGCAVLGYNVSIVDQVVDFFSLLFLLYDSLLENYALTSLSLPTSLVTIPDYAFIYCVALPTVIIPT